MSVKFLDPALELPVKRSSVCFFTGHRALPRGLENDICSELYSRLVRCVEERGVLGFMAGGALGFDTLAAICVLRLREKHPEIKLFIAVPHRGQASRWDGRDRELYERILSEADGVYVLGERYFRGCMQARNRFMVDRSGGGFAWLTEPSGGTKYTCDYARRQGVRVVQLAEAFYGRF